MKALALGLLLWGAPAWASSHQGCASCRDNVSGSAPKVQQGFRRAIPVLGIPAAAIFVVALALAASSPDGREAPSAPKANRED